MKKADALKHWRALEAGQNPLPHMHPIPYKATGSRYGACGVRIDGTPEFVDAVLSCLKDLLGGENGHTRLELARHAAATGFKACPNATIKSEVCYVRLHERGHESKTMHARYGVAC